MNPIIVMAVWGRLPLVDINIRLLLSQGAQIVLVTSIEQDYNYFKLLKLAGVHIISVPNNPLGKKWQSGVDKAKELGANPLIICGSDDFLSNGFIKKACDYSRYHDFIFFDNWWIYEPRGNKSYYLRYNMFRYDKPPLGSGRIYAPRMLDRNGWSIFDSGKDWHLDNHSWETKHFEDRLFPNPDGMNILAVKGFWETMNPLDKILNSDTIDWNEEPDIDSHFNFSKKISEIFKGL
jgi:hypothetical protein